MTSPDRDHVRDRGPGRRPDCPVDPAPFDPAPSTRSARYRLDPRVALRPEPFGALAYHYGNRRLTLLRAPELVRPGPGIGRLPERAGRLRRRRHRRPPLASFEKALTSLAAVGLPRRGATTDRPTGVGPDVAHRRRPRVPVVDRPHARGPPTRGTTHGRPAQGRAQRPDLPHLGVDLRLQPAVRPLPRARRAAAIPHELTTDEMKAHRRRPRRPRRVLREHRWRRAHAAARLLRDRRVLRRARRRREVLDQRRAA